ncbi:hypothetical protein GBA52_008075 [Prunus armeniaca]|nr:hypothetical protein GBA52_008075 [Prunus armeniaca]
MDSAIPINGAEPHTHWRNPKLLETSTQNTQSLEEEQSTPLGIASPPGCFGPSSRYLRKKGNEDLIHYSMVVQESTSSDKPFDRKRPQHQYPMRLGLVIHGIMFQLFPLVSVHVKAI